MEWMSKHQKGYFSISGQANLIFSLVFSFTVLNMFKTSVLILVR